MEEQLLLMISKQLDELTALVERKERHQGKKIGRPTKEHIVARYRANYPNANKMACVRATQLCIKTVSKYWDEVLEKKSEWTC